MDQTDTINSYSKKLSATLDSFSANEKADAAVALLLCPVINDLKILVVKRVKSMIDPWSGQIALPGGKRCPSDVDLMATVLRETWEEISVNLQDGSQLLGVMNVESTALRPQLMVLPFVFLLDSEPAIRLNAAELEWFTWTSVEQLRLHKRTVQFPFGEFPAFAFADNMIWGLTFRILEKLFNILK